MLKKVFYYAVLILIYLISLLPFWVLYLISDGIYVMLYHISRYRRMVVAENLKNAFPDKSSEDRAVIGKKFYRHLADLIVESIKLLTISRAEVSRRVHVPNPELITDAFAQGQSVLGILGHYGNWEMSALRFSQLFDERRIIIYKPLTDRFFDNAVIKMRSRFGATLIDMKNTMRRLITYRNERTVTVLVGDQTPAKSEISYFTNFLNQPTAVFLGVEKLAKITNSVVVFCDIRRLSRGHYRCTFIPMFANPRESGEYEITNAHVRYLEQVIRESPEYWLWSHRRWKFKPEA
ncbi:lysophospholipid acyltransferase family protein [Pedobacter duraquae]|uniref:KDO2-lipid IV(A) lauroyltransferase n=1 Tax=Pedobacter duraquae TaxID=425511 RepID=A0A4R6IFC3_9SPHI|nr:lysophospholipid acyltransferase family protein [Pedobacter duraquae]TDO20772.1 KDO2-lipid IV(A) lauroyltransferase [Pedobacter duraquae]